MLPPELKTVVDLTIGDGTIGWTNGSWKFKYTHTEPQRAYALHKKELLESVGFKPKLIEYPSKSSYRPGDTQIEIYFYHRGLAEVRKLLYPNGKKELSPQILQILDAQTLAYWYMDDGCVDTYNKTKSRDYWYVYERRVARSYKLATNCFSEDTHAAIFQWLKDVFDIHGTLSNTRSGPNVIISRISSKDRFLSVIKPYIIPSMNYKIKYPHRFEGIPSVAIPRNTDSGERLNETTPLRREMR